jgi:hypothetical protein
MPAGGESSRDAMDAGDRRLRLDALRSRPEGQRDDSDRGKAPNRLTPLHSAFAAKLGDDFAMISSALCISTAACGRAPARGRSRNLEALCSERCEGLAGEHLA